MRKIYYLFLAAFLMPALMFAQDPANSTCADAVVQPLVVNGPMVSVSGSATNAVDIEGMGATHVWEAFSVTECADVTIDFCNSADTIGTFYPAIFPDCIITNAAAVQAFDYDFTTCEDLTLTFIQLEPGTYYFPIISSIEEGEAVLADYTVNFLATTCTPEPDTCLYFAPIYGDLNTAWGGAPAANANGVCPTFEINTFEVFANELFAVDNFVAGTEYTFSICDGPNAGSWAPKLTIISAADISIVAMVDGCSITWTSPTSGTYLIGITEVGACYSSQNDGQGGENGYPKLSCTGTTTGLSEADKATFSVYPNPSNGQFTIGNVDVAGSYTIEVIDLAGRVIHSQVSALSANTETKVNLNEVAAGVYMVKMINTNDNTQAVQRIVIK